MRGRTWPWFALSLTAALMVAAGALFAGSGSVPASPSPPSTPPATRTSDQRRQDDINRVMEFLRVTQPDVYDQARVLRVTDPLRFDRLILGALPTVNRLETTRKRSQKLFDLSMQDLQLGYQSLRIANALKLPGTSYADRKKLTDQLSAIVTAEFEVQQQIRQFEIDDLQQKVKDLDSQVKDREQGKAAILQKRLDDLIQHDTVLVP